MKIEIYGETETTLTNNTACNEIIFGQDDCDGGWHEVYIKKESLPKLIEELQKLI